MIQAALYLMSDNPEAGIHMPRRNHEVYAP
jgi:hypothetical protein